MLDNFEGFYRLIYKLRGNDSEFSAVFATLNAALDYMRKNKEYLSMYQIVPFKHC